MQAFLDKAPMADMLTRVPVKVILNAESGLIGAATRANELGARMTTRTKAQRYTALTTVKLLRASASDSNVSNTVDNRQIANRSCTFLVRFSSLI